jgi:ADP-ribose pyrophosphatase YjhB (NUDIX family)
MLIFVNNKPIEISEPKSKIELEPTDFDAIFDLKTDIVEFNNLKGKVFIKSADFKGILRFFEFAQNNKNLEINHLTLEIDDLKKFKNRLKTSLEVIKASGGVVTNKNNKILMMKRLGFWDLPKGKADPGEKSKETAKREVEEECNVKVFVNQKICTTWHTYLLKGKMVIKQTKWYAMDLLSDAKMKPQKEEGIEKLEWMDQGQINEALKESYSSIEYVLKKYVLKTSLTTKF